MTTTNTSDANPSLTPEQLDAFAERLSATWESPVTDAPRVSHTPGAFASHAEVVVDDVNEDVVPNNTRTTFIVLTLAATLGLGAVFAFVGSSAPSPTELRLPDPPPVIRPPAPMPDLPSAPPAPATPVAAPAPPAPATPVAAPAPPAPAPAPPAPSPAPAPRLAAPSPTPARTELTPRVPAPPRTKRPARSQPAAARPANGGSFVDENPY